MANTIKGLTVEIGGDTTQLGKALEDVNKKSRNLSSELGDINRLLKLDPGNTDLLSQKQKVLADAISNTGKKLDTLKEAEKQVQQQFERGEVSEEQVRALQREIIATEKKMNGYEKAAKETEKALRGVGDESEKVEKSSGKLGDALGNAAKVGMQAVAAAATAAVTGLIAAAESTREYRTEMGKLETAFTQSGHSAEAGTAAYKEMQGILGETDQAVEAVNHLAKLTDNEKDLAKWTGDILPGVFATFGASLPIEGLTEAANETAKVGQVTGPLADALNWAGISEDKFNESLAKCNSEQERQTLITETLAGLYGDASAAYKETNAEVIRANKANEDWMASMAGVGGAIEPIITDVKSMGASLLTDLVPGVQQLAGSFRDLLNGDAGAAEGIGTALSGIITQLLVKVTELAPTLAQTAISLVTSLTTTLITMIPQLITTGVQVIMALLQGITQAIPQITSAIVNMIPQLVNALVLGIPQLMQGTVQLLLAIVQAVPQIIPPLVEAIPSIIMAIIDGLLVAIPQLIQGALQFLMAIVDAIPQLIQALVPQIPTIVKTLIDGLISNIPALLDGAVQLLYAVIDAIPLIINALVPEIPNIVFTVIDCLIENIPLLLSAAVDLFMALVDAIPKILGSLGTALGTIWTTIKSYFSKLPAKMGAVGKELITGLWNGIKDMGSWIKKKISGFTSGILDSIKSFFGIKSPSRVMRDQVGKNLALGLATGIDKNAKVATKSAEDMARDLLDGVDSKISQPLVSAEEASKKLLDAAKKKLDTYKVYNELTLADEVAYWDEVRKQCAEGTEARINADKSYFTAKKSMTSEVMKLNATYEADVKKVQDNLVKDIQAVTKAYDDAVEKRQNQIKSSMGLFDELKLDEGLTADMLINNLTNQVDVLTAWDDKLDKLANRKGMDADLLAELQSMGPDSVLTVQSILHMTDAEFAEYIGLYQQKSQIALERATTENTSLLSETQAQIKSLTDNAALDLQTIEDTYITGLEEIGINTAEASHGVGVNIVDGLKEGVLSKQAEMQAFLTGFFNRLVLNAKATLDINSPSRIFADEVGKQIPAGVAQGIRDNSKMADTALARLFGGLTDQANHIGGIGFERSLNSRQAGAALGAAGGLGDTSSLLTKLDGIYERLGRLQVVLDGRTLVGEILDPIDAGLGMKQALHARGV